jgi:hypothetical protein
MAKMSSLVQPSFCVAGVPGVAGGCGSGREARANVMAALMVHQICNGGAAARTACAMPAPDYITLGPKFLNTLAKGRGVSLDTTFTVTRTGTISNTTTAGLKGKSFSKGASGSPFDVEVGWLYDEDQRATDEQISQYPAAGLSASASVSVSIFNQKIFSVDESVGAKSDLSVERITLPPAPISASASAGASLTTRLGEVGQLW